MQNGKKTCGISEKLKQARLLENLTQEELAEKIGVSRQTISNWENARSYPDIVSILYVIRKSI